MVEQEQLARAVRAVVHECLAVREGEEVLAERASHAAEPPESVAAAMKAADVVLAPTVQSLSHTAARKAASEAGARIATLPGVTEEMLARVMSADMAELRRKGRAVADALDRGSVARISCAQGSDLRLGLEGREAIPDAGELGDAGAFGNLPCGEGFIAPVEGTCEGTLVVDGTIAGVGIPGAPVQMTVVDGRLAEASGEEGAALLALLREHGEEATTVAELGIGTNEKAELTGNVLEDEKILGTVHVAFGASAAIGGTVQVPVHLDCVVMRPTVEVDGEAVLRDGELLL
jgi:leucyl aminopeptidase (aminopeptidase T)